MSNNIKENQIISIVGATATGKTATALALAEKLLSLKLVKVVHLLSADSRQVYRGLENLTGADLSTDFVATKDSHFGYPSFTNPTENIFLHGVSVIDPNNDWSVAHFQKLFTEIKSQLSEGEVLIVVGGTGFYQQQIANTAETIIIPQNEILRQKLEKLNLTELQNQLKNLNKEKLESMNNSDLNNPRRLVRAIEIALYRIEQPVVVKQTSTQTNKSFYLELPKTIREEKIKQRVIDRFMLAKKEVEQQLQNKEISVLATTCTGFMELAQFIRGEIDQKTCLAKWQLAEIQYAKRQDTWWKKRSDLIKLDAEKTKTIADKIIHTCYI
jgi:tRNA dimethylallyltransferase